MSHKRKRGVPHFQLRKPGELEEPEETFINNSDYPQSDSNLGFLNGENEDDDDASNASLEGFPGPQIKNEALPPVTLAPGDPDAKVFPGSPRVSLRKVLQEEQFLSSRQHTPDMALTASQVEPVITEKPRLPISPTKTPLSFSQQQVEFLQHTPTKKRVSKPSTPSTEPRLVIHQLALTNFKSYAGTQMIGPFNASFSAVVGPNGSGKSNVIDSLLFVFGFRALKMRQGKLSELIHNSAQEDRLDFCQVDIHFQHVTDDPHHEGVSHIVPDSGLVISRRATRLNQSTYYINGKGSNYTQVTDYLKGKGIDLEHKRFLILQGEVESIAQMKAKAERESDDGLLEYLEDIIGTARYKQLIDDNLARIELLNEGCLEKENRFQLVEKDKSQLEDKKDQALRFFEVQKKLATTKSIQFQARISKNQTILEENQRVINNLTATLKEKLDANKEFTAKIKDTLDQESLIKRHLAAAAKNLSKANEQQREIKRLGVSLDEKSKNYASKLKKALKNKELLVHALAQSQAKLESCTLEMSQARTDLDLLAEKLEEERAKLSEIRHSLTSKTSHLTEQIELLQLQLDPWNAKIKEKESTIGLITSTIEMLTTEKAAKSKQLDDARQRLMDIKTEGKQKEADFAEQTTKLEKIIEQITLGEEQCAHERQSVADKHARMTSFRQKTQDAATSLSLIENKSQVLTSLTRLAKSGRIEGFHGRLGDLGVIDDVYDAAISTACPGLDSMVVETVETAQTCIEYLRKNRLGYATFICLDKLRDFNMAPIQTPGDPNRVKRLFDLIKPQNQKFAPAFYSKLFNTLVAPNLNEAKRVAYGAKRWKVVTLDGKVVDTSGAMTGGGNFVAKGMMKLANSHRPGAAEFSAEDVAQMQQELASLESKYEEADSELRHKEEILLKLKLIKPETEFLISRLRLDIELLSAEKKEITAVCRSLLAESEDSDFQQRYDAPIAENTEKLQVLDAEKAEIKLQMVDLEAQIQALQESIMQMGGVELKLQNSRVDSTKQQIEIINERTSSNRMETRKLEKSIERNTKISHDAQADIANLNAMIEETNASLVQQATALEEVEKSIAEMQSVKSDKEEELEALSVQLSEHQEIVSKFKSAKIEIEHKLEKHLALLKTAQRRINDDRAHLQSLNTIDAEPYLFWMDEQDRERYDGGILKEFLAQELEEMDLEVVNNDVEQLEKYMASVKVDIEVLKEYGLKKQEHESRRIELNEAVSERDEVVVLCEKLKKDRLDEFMAGFHEISMTLKDMYRMITMGGNAELELVDSLDPFSEGILFSVMPPKKSWKNISNLLGGEKTLSSLALVFALHQYKPTPLYVMDEIDAALDFRNVSIVANYIKERTRNAQFVVISLRNNMFELAQQLVGIYKVENKTKSVSLQNRDFLDQEA